MRHAILRPLDGNRPPSIIAASLLHWVIQYRLVPIVIPEETILTPLPTAMHAIDRITTAPPTPVIRLLLFQLYAHSVIQPIPDGPPHPIPSMMHSSSRFTREGTGVNGRNAVNVIPILPITPRSIVYPAMPMRTAGRIIQTHNATTATRPDEEIKI